MKFALLVLLPLFWLSPQDPEVLTLGLENGDTIRAQVLELDGDRAKLKVLVLGGSMQVTRRLSEFTPSSIFQIEEQAAAPDSYDDYFALAKRAAELGLLGPAGANARAAIEQVAGQPDAEAKTAQVRGWGADTLESWTKDAVAENDTKSAKHYLKLLSTRLADLRTEEQLDALAAMVEGLDDQIAANKSAERQAKRDEKERKEIESRFKPIDELIDRGDKLQRDAISKSRNTSQSARLAEQSIEAYKAAWQRTQAVQKKYPENPDVAQEVEAIGGRLHDSAIRSALHAANVLTVQSDYRGAMDWCNKVLAYDPGNAEAKEMVRTIQIASAAASRQWGWGWSVVGGTDWRRRR